jgi:hypothetical protein
MTTPTPAEYLRAKRLVAATAARKRERLQLASMVEAGRIAVSASSDARRRRLDFSQPEQLAGLIELCRRTDSDTVHSATLQYHWLLQSMIETITPAVRPRRIDFNALPPAARPYLLAPFLDLAVGGVFPHLCFELSEPQQGRLTYVMTGGPANPDAWRSQLPQISLWLGGNWTLAEHTANTITLEQRPALPDVIAFDPRHLRAGALFLGFDVDTHKAALIPFSELSSGTYISGSAGSGKTSATHLLIKNLFANTDLFTAVYLVDGKDGVAMARYEGLHPKVRVLYDEPDVWDLTAELATTIRQRNAEQRAAGIENATRDFIALVVDELPTYISKPSAEAKNPDNKQHAQFLDNINRLAMRGRSTGMRMFFVTQTPVAEQIPVTLRANCQTTIAFRLPENAHATALFGQLESLPADPRSLSRGRALVKEGLTGKISHVQFPLVPLPKPRGQP